MGFICFLIILANFWASLVISCPFWFLRDIRHFQYLKYNFFPRKRLQNGIQPDLFPGIFLIFPLLLFKDFSKENTIRKNNPLDTSYIYKYVTKKSWQ